jgi:hypothetical protein
MIGVTSGKVIELVGGGFRIRTDDGAEFKVRTFGDGWELDLCAGDEVRVTGGPDPRSNTFVWASSSIYRRRGSEWLEIGDPGADSGSRIPARRLETRIRRLMLGLFRRQQA